jgi:uncharacterized protein YjlB
VRRQLAALAALAEPAEPAEIAEEAMTARAPRSELLADSGEFPNSRCPVLVYENVFTPSGDLASSFEELFARNGWTGAWRNGLYRQHHFHSTAHEVLGVSRGSVRVRLGGPAGPLIDLKAGDVAVIPAGVAHKNEAQSADFAVVGAYPSGTSPDMQYGKPGERPNVDQNIARLERPALDPVEGVNGSLVRLWG